MLHRTSHHRGLVGALLVCSLVVCSLAATPSAQATPRAPTPGPTAAKAAVQRWKLRRQHRPLLVARTTPVRSTTARPAAAARPDGAASRIEANRAVERRAPRTRTGSPLGVLAAFAGTTTFFFGLFEYFEAHSEVASMAHDPLGWLLNAAIASGVGFLAMFGAAGGE